MKRHILVMLMMVIPFTVSCGSPDRQDQEETKPTQLHKTTKRGGMEAPEGVAQNNEEAVGHPRAAEQEDAEALYRLGLAYLHGEGVAQNDMEAFKLFRKAAELGHAKAQIMVGTAYAHAWAGLVFAGFALDYEEAAKWFRKAAKQGDEEAIQWLTVLEERKLFDER